MANNALREHKQSEIDPGKHETKVNHNQGGEALALKIIIQTTSAEPDIRGIVGDQDQDTDGDLIGEIREEDEEDSNAMMQEHFPELGFSPFIDDMINQSVEMPAELNLIEEHSMGEIGDNGGIFIDVTALGVTSEVSGEEKGIVEKDISQNAGEGIVDDVHEPGGSLEGSGGSFFFSGVLYGVHLGLQPRSEELDAKIFVDEESKSGDSSKLKVINREFGDLSKVGVVMEVVDEIESVYTPGDETVEEDLEDDFPALEFSNILQDGVKVKLGLLLALGDLRGGDGLGLIHGNFGVYLFFYKFKKENWDVQFIV